MLVSNFDELIKVSHEMAIEKGWWPEDKKRSVPEIFANLHSELSESWEEYRRGRMLPWHECVDPDHKDRTVYSYEQLDDFPDGPKPEGFGVELADFLIRLADWCGSIGIKKIEARDAEIAPDYKIKADDMIIFLHITTSKLFSLADGIYSGDAVFEELLSIFSGQTSERAREVLDNRKARLTSQMVSRAVHCCLNQIKSFMGIDNLWKVVNIKLLYNQSRGFRHGNLLA